MSRWQSHVGFPDWREFLRVASEVPRSCCMRCGHGATSPIQVPPRRNGSRTEYWRAQTSPSIRLSTVFFAAVRNVQGAETATNDAYTHSGVAAHRLARVVEPRDPIAPRSTSLLTPPLSPPLPCSCALGRKHHGCRDCPTARRLPSGSSTNLAYKACQCAWASSHAAAARQHMQWATLLCSQRWLAHAPAPGTRSSAV